MEEHYVKKDRRLFYGILIGLVIAGLIVGGYFLFNYEKSNYLSQGYNQGALSVIQSISQTGNIPYFQNTSNGTSIQQISIQNLCQNLNNQGKTG